jgi:hypothetical protein
MEGMEWALHNLGLLYADQGKLAEAETMYTRALQGFINSSIDYRVDIAPIHQPSPEFQRTEDCPSQSLSSM